MDKLFLYFIKKKIYLLVILILFILSFFFISLKIDGSIDNFLIKDDPQKIIYHKFIKIFGSDNNVIISIGNKNLFSYEKLLKVKNIISDLKKLNGIIDVDSIFNQKNIINKNDTLYTNLIIDPFDIPKDKRTLLQIKKDALKNPLIRKIFISKDGNYIFLNVRLKNDRSSEYSNYITNSIHKILNKYKQNFNILKQFGYAYIEKNIEDNVKKDFTFTIPLAIIIIILILYLNLKNIQLTLIPVITALLSVIITFGIMGFLGIKLTILTALVPVLIILIGSTEDSHIISEYLTEVQEKNNKKRKYIVHIINKNTLLAIILTATTTIIGFASIYFNDIVMLKEFSIVATIGLLINFIITLIVVPNYLYHLNLDKIRLMKRKPYNYSFFINLVEKFYYKGDKFVMILILLIIFLFIFLFPKIVIDNNTLNYFKKNSEIIKRTDFIEKHIYGAKTFYIVLDTNKKNAFKNYKYLHSLEKIKNYILTKSKFNYAVSLADYISYVNEVIQNNKIFYKVPKNELLIKEYLLFFYKKDLRNYINSNFSKANMIVWHNIFSSNKFNLEIKKLKDYISKNIDPNIKVHILGQSILIAKAATTIAKGELYSILVTISVAFLLILLTFKSFKSLRAGLTIILANCLPILVVFIIIALFNIQLNMITAMVAAISFGIIIDDTIHIMLRYKFELINNKNKTSAILNAIKKEGRPVILTSLFLSIGFLVLLTSQFVPVEQYAFLTICVIIFGLLTDLYILPIVMKNLLKE